MAKGPGLKFLFCIISETSTDRLSNVRRLLLEYLPTFCEGRPNVRRRPTNCVSKVYRMFVEGLPTVVRRFTACSSNVYRLFVEHLPIVCRIPIDCLLKIHRLFIFIEDLLAGLPTVYQSTADCLPINCRTFTDCLTNACHLSLYIITFFTYKAVLPFPSQKQTLAPLLTICLIILKLPLLASSAISLWL